MSKLPMPAEKLANPEKFKQFAYKLRDYCIKNNIDIRKLGNSKMLNLAAACFDYKNWPHLDSTFKTNALNSPSIHQEASALPQSDSDANSDIRDKYKPDLNIIKDYFETNPLIKSDHSEPRDHFSAAESDHKDRIPDDVFDLLESEHIFRRGDIFRLATVRDVGQVISNTRIYAHGDNGWVPCTADDMTPFSAHLRSLLIGYYTPGESIMFGVADLVATKVYRPDIDPMTDRGSRVARLYRTTFGLSAVTRGFPDPQRLMSRRGKKPDGLFDIQENSLFIRTPQDQKEKHKKLIIEVLGGISINEASRLNEIPHYQAGKLVEDACRMISAKEGFSFSFSLTEARARKDLIIPYLDLYLTGLSQNPARAREIKLVRDLELNVRVSNILAADNIYHIEDLLAKTENQISSLPNAGPGAIKEIKAVLSQYGMKLAAKKEE